MSIGTIRGKHGNYPVEVINGAVYYRDSSGRTVGTGFTTGQKSGNFIGPDGSLHDQQSALRSIQSRYDQGRYS